MGGGLTMRPFRLFRGITILLGSSLISYLLTLSFGVDEVGSIAITTLVGFVAGLYFASGVYSK